MNPSCQRKASVYPKPEVIVVTPPATYPVTSDEVREHLRLDEGEEPLIVRLIAAATDHVERVHLWRSLITRTLQAIADDFPRSFPREIPLARPPVQAVSLVRYRNPGEEWTTLSGSTYGVRKPRSDPHLVTLHCWPGPVSELPGAVEITYTAGYGDRSAIPEPIRHAILLLVGHWYERRELATTGSLMSIPEGVDQLLAGFSSRGFA